MHTRWWWPSLPGTVLLLMAFGLHVPSVVRWLGLSGIMSGAVPGIAGSVLSVILAAVGGGVLSMTLARYRALRVSAVFEQYQRLADYAGEGLAVVRDGRIVLANHRLAGWLGCKPETLSGLRLDDPNILPGLENAQTTSDTRSSSRDTAVMTYDTTLLCRAGERIAVRVQVMPTADRGVLGNVVRVQDIRAQQAADEQIRVLKEYTDSIIDSADIWLSTLDMQGRIVIWNKAAERISGYTRDEVVGQTAIWEWLYPDERHRQTVLSGSMSIPTQDSALFETETTIRTRDGRNVILSWTSRVLTNTAGDRVGSLAVARDVTLERRAQDALRLHASVFETADPLAITNREGVLLKVNRAFVRMFGYSADEIGGYCLSDLQRMPDDSGEYVQSSSGLPREALRENGHWSGEVEARRKDASQLPARLSVSTVRNNEDDVTHYVAHWQDISEHKAFEAQIQRQALYDPLTGLPNRRLARIRLEQDLGRARRHAGFGALLFLDLDHFKRINDAHGHTAGDALLASIAHRLRDVLRTDDMAARLGGDEFIVLLSAEPGSRDDTATRAGNVAQKILYEMRRPVSVGEYELSVSASVGIALFPVDDLDAERLLQMADSAMYRAKGAGRNTACFFSETVQAETEQRLSLYSQLREALNEEQLRLHYQPIVDARGGIVAVEALVRWQQPGHGARVPAEFMPVAEETGLAADIELWVLRTACMRLSDWYEQGVLPLDCRLMVNLSPRLLARQEFAEQLETILTETGAPPTSLVIEIDEGALQGQIAPLIEPLQRLKACGLHFSVDAFGTGHVPLAQLKRLPVTAVKLAPSLVCGVPQDTLNAQVVEALLGVAGSLQLEVVAEGVCVEEEYTYLHARGCTCFQGAWLSAPVTLAPIEALLRHGSVQPGNVQARSLQPESDPA